ncbi:MAG: 2-C-methyl-D-erythritol 2,4-cyclodiphosphate synthase [Bacteroidales bacterium]|jgi:2-C-methyl-D-erythritol 2,4-cyclodiphosphate synthase|nr:2-C-methyl-D-erythritol 2,4-cyclodiphosphate synthase [Bacteroidales bacterium]MBR4637960.1 2-C-methyl-D-erythritol 2,4-cyclodiphosphate synthase [Bacteroidales bacterium]MBR6174826.1 2-C-methyl-D-erythritol 2,4-cyclodiphosphate synthase [Bacteroidales bacterium]MBR6903885.1 2-C-methyl-D-erythritol 2,4-cyclodiphosphate synthase [Bacteroidales bacterium]
MDFRVGFGYDSHRFAPGRPLVIGGVVVPYELGLAAHSDGDVLIHAVCDALLGAAGLKDIGTWFPDTDDTYKNADSTLLLAKVVEVVKERGWQVNNLDCTLVLERPKMKPHIDNIILKLSQLLDVSSENIAVKAKTNEKMGFTGAGEGIAAVAAVTLRKPF